MYTEVKIAWKKFSESLRELAMEIINYKKKKMKLLTKEQLKSYKNAKICYIYKKKIKKIKLKRQTC